MKRVYLTIPRLPIRPNSRLPIRPRRPRLDVKVHRARRTILIIVTSAPTPVIAIREARINHLERDSRAARDAIIIRIEAARGELVADTASVSAIGLAGAVEAALEELLVDGAIIHSRATGPLPRVFAAVARAALEAVVLAGC